MDELAGVFLNQVIERCGEKLTLSPEEVSSGRVQTADDALAAGLIADLAALEDLTRDLYKDRPLHIYSTTPSVAEQLGVAQMLFRAPASAVTSVVSGSHGAAQALPDRRHSMSAGAARI